MAASAQRSRTKAAGTRMPRRLFSPLCFDAERRKIEIANLLRLLGRGQLTRLHGPLDSLPVGIARDGKIVIGL